MVYFPSPHAGLAAFRNLREFRVLHEKSYPLKLIEEKEGKRKGLLLPKKSRGKVLMDQKANSVADLAAVLLLQEKGPSQERIASAERRRRRVETLKKQKGGDKVKKAPIDVLAEMGGVEGVRVRWANLEDSEFAAIWPKGVDHGVLQQSRYTAAFPAIETVEDENGLRNELVVDGGDGGWGRGGEVSGLQLDSALGKDARK